MDEDAKLAARPFLLMEGGPLFTLQKRVGLIREGAPYLKRRAVFAALSTWVPLLILAGMQGLAFGHNVPVPFLSDFSGYSRFLLAVPLLLLAENVLGPRIAEAAAHFVTSGVIREKDFQQFDELVDRGLRFRDSVAAEIVIVALAYAFSWVSFREIPNHLATWFRSSPETGGTLTWAGYWLVGFCMPLFQFLVLRWLWRLFLWFYFLSGVCKLDLQLLRLHRKVEAPPGRSSYVIAPCACESASIDTFIANGHAIKRHLEVTAQSVCVDGAAFGRMATPA